MASFYYGPTNDDLRKKLYQRKKEFNNFRDISEERINEIKEMVEAFFKRADIINIKSDTYHKALLFLTNPRINLKLPTFDEKMLFLILVSDPTVESYKDYLAQVSITKNDIVAEPNDYRKEQLINQRLQERSTFKSNQFYKLGFEDMEMVYYESLFFHRYLKDKFFIEKVKGDHLTDLTHLFSLIRNFKGRSDEDFARINEIAQLYLSRTNKPTPNTTAFHLFQQAELVGLDRITDKALFFILTQDPNLDMIRIYEEGNNTGEIREQMIQAFGTYSPTLINLEKKYHERFCPERQVCDWYPLEKK